LSRKRYTKPVIIENRKRQRLVLVGCCFGGGRIYGRKECLDKIRKEFVLK